MKERRKYNLDIVLNKRHFHLLVIDSHYEKKHPDINDKLILELVEQLNGINIEIADKSDGFKYLAYGMCFNAKAYRLVLTNCEEDFLGVINVFRVKEKKQ
jgi:hypothetical protein